MVLARPSLVFIATLFAMTALYYNISTKFPLIHKTSGMDNTEGKQTVSSHASRQARLNKGLNNGPEVREKRGVKTDEILEQMEDLAISVAEKRAPIALSTTSENSTPFAASSGVGGNVTVSGPNAPPGSCANSCGQRGDRLTCHCDSACVVYKACCQDLAEVCPDVLEEARTKLSKDLLEASVECDTDIGRYVVTKCPDGRSSYEDIHYNDSAVHFIEKIRYSAYVYDSLTEVLYKNLIVYECFATENSVPIVWNATVEVNGDTDLKTTEELVQLVASSRMVFIPPYFIAESEGHACTKPEKPRGFLFSIVMDLTEAQQIYITSSQGKPMGWETLSCDLNSTGTCIHKTCLTSYSVILNGRCIFHGAGTVRIVHPPEPLSAGCVEDVAQFLTCMLQEMSGMTSADVNNLVPVATDDPAFRLIPRLPNETVRSFRIDFGLSLDGSMLIGNLPEMILKAIAYYFMQSNLVYGYTDLQYLQVIQSGRRSLDNNSEILIDGHTTAFSTTAATHVTSMSTPKHLQRNAKPSSQSRCWQDTTKVDVDAIKTETDHVKYPIICTKFSLGTITSFQGDTKCVPIYILKYTEEEFPYCQPDDIISQNDASSSHLKRPELMVVSVTLLIGVSL